MSDVRFRRARRVRAQPVIEWLYNMTDQERQTAETLLSRIEVAVGEIQDRRGPNAVLIKSIIESVNGLRSLMSVVRTH